MWIFTATMMLAPALAQEPAPAECAWNTTATVEPVRPPGVPATTRDFEECLVTLDIDGEGHPSVTKDVLGCPTIFGEAAVDAFVQWRFEPCVLENRPFEGEITLAAKFASSEFQALLPEKYQERMDEHEALKPSGDACQMELDVRTDGTITRIATNNPTHCLVSARRLPSQHNLGLKKQVTCEVAFTATQTRTLADDVQVEKCKDEKVVRYARTAAAAFAWNSPIGGSEPYAVTIVLGPEK